MNEKGVSRKPTFVIMAKQRTALSRGVPLPLPALDSRLCTGCGDCVFVCPTDCLDMRGPLPWLPRPVDCISCALCVAICPPRALRIED